MSEALTTLPTEARVTDERTAADGNGRTTVRYGVYTEAAVLPHENKRELRELRRQVRACVRPQGAVEQILVDQVVMLTWRLRRNLETEARVAEALIADQRHLLTVEARNASAFYGKSYEPRQVPDETLYAWAVKSAEGSGVLHRLSLQESRPQRQLERALRELWRLQVARGKTGLPDQLEVAILGALTRSGGLPAREAYLEKRREQAWSGGRGDDN